MNATRKQSAIDAIIVLACLELNCSPDQVFSPDRCRNTTDARRVISYLLNRRLNMDNMDVAVVLKRDRATVLIHLKRTQDLIDIKDSIITSIRNVEAKLNRILKYNFVTI